ncbi:MAG: hypothetical protein Q9227_005080 [Pyrenula ochraceoflavens]
MDEDEESDEVDEDGSGKSHHCRESPDELREKDELFTQDINFVFATLKTIEERVSSGKLQLTIYNAVREVHACPHRKNPGWRLHLLSPDTLPELTSVQTLCLQDEMVANHLTENSSSLKIDLRLLTDLTVKLPRLAFLRCRLGVGDGWTTYIADEGARHFSRDWAGLCRDNRHQFAQSIETAALPPTLRHAQLDFLYPLSRAERIDQTQEVPDVVAPASFDPFSSSLRLLSQQLRKLELKVVADATLFWPADGTVSWPYLESICIVFHLSSPSGRWYFVGPQGEGRDSKGFEITRSSYPPLEDTSDDEFWDEYIEDNGLRPTEVECKQFRVVPNDEVLVPFLTAFAKAASSMPVLKEAYLWAPLVWRASSIDEYEDYDDAQIAKWPSEPLAWGIAYAAPATHGFYPFRGQRYSESRQLWWMTAQWRPNDDLRFLFQQIGDQNTELVEYWGDGDCEQKLADRDIFEQMKIFDSRWPHPWGIKNGGYDWQQPGL